MALRQPFFLNIVPHISRQAQQAQLVGERRLALTQLFADLLLRQSKMLVQMRNSQGFLKEI